MNMSFARISLLAVLFGFWLGRPEVASSQQDSQDNQPHIQPQRDSSSSKAKPRAKPDAPVPDRPAAAPPDNPAEPTPAREERGESSSNDSQINLEAAPRDREPAATVSDDKELLPYDPHRAEKDIEVGNYHLRLKNYRAALDRFNDALLYKPGDAEATYGLAFTEEKLDLLSQAYKNYQAYLKILPEGPRAKDAQEAIRRIGPQVDMREHSEVKEENKDVEHDLSVAETYLSMNNFGAARERLEEAVRLDPQNARACFRLAQSLQGLRQIEPARLYYEKYLELDPKGPFAANAKKEIAAIKDFMK